MRKDDMMAVRPGERGGRGGGEKGMGCMLHSNSV